MKQINSLSYRVVLELLLLSIPILAFSLSLIWNFGFQVYSLITHLRIVSVILFFIFLGRLICSRIIQKKDLYLFFSALLVSSFSISLMLYYFLVHISLSHWNRIITAEIVTAYLSQLGSLLRVADVVPGYALALMLFILVGFSYFWWVTLKRIDYVWELKGMALRWYSFPILISFCLFAVNDLVAFKAGYFAMLGEPISTTFFSELATERFQSNSAGVHETEKNDELARQVRLNYHSVDNVDKKNVIVIVADALRPDHMSAYQYERKTTANIDQLIAKYGIYQSNQMHAVCNESSCGLFALASSKYLHQFSHSPFTLQEALRKNDYTIRMILSGDHTNFYGLREIYGEVDDYFDGSKQEGYYINDDNLVTSRLQRLQDWSGKPEFIQFHLMASHGMGQKSIPGSDYVNQVNYYSKKVDLDELKKNKWNRVVNFYDSGVWTVDQHVSKILNILEQKNYLQNTLVVITADHGELLGENNQFGHSHSVIEPVLKIPFLMLSYGDGKKKRELQVSNEIQSQVDIAPTILRELGLKIPENWSGKPLQDGLSHDFIYFKSNQESGLFDLRLSDGVYKYWRNGKTRQEFVYKVFSDQTEQQNLVTSIPVKQRQQWLLQLP